MKKRRIKIDLIFYAKDYRPSFDETFAETLTR